MHFFQICDEAVSYAEVYSQKKATALDKLEKVVLADILGLVLIIGTELVKAVPFCRTEQDPSEKSLPR